MPFFFKNNKFLKNRIGSHSLKSTSREGFELPGFPLPCLREAGTEMRQKEVCSFCNIPIKLVNEMNIQSATNR
jgi:hypothetical protein